MLAMEKAPSKYPLRGDIVSSVCFILNKVLRVIGVGVSLEKA
jgi:hypothetical protein